MADLPSISASAQQLVRDPNATPDQLLAAMRNVLDAKKPWYYGIGHYAEKAELSLIGGSDRKNFVDVFEDQYNQYQQWIDGWRSGANAKSDYPQIVKVGKGLLQATLDIPKEKIGDTSMLADAAKDKVVAGQNAAIDLAKKAADLATKAGSGITEALFTLAIVYIAFNAISKR